MANPASSERETFALLIAVSMCRLVAALAVVKALAYLYGPVEFGAATQLMGLSAMFYMLAGGGIGSGLMLHVAGETRDDARGAWLAAALAFALGAGAVLLLAGVLLYTVAADGLLPASIPPRLILAIACTQIVVGIGNVLTQYASAAGDVRTFAAANIGATLIWAGAVAVTAATAGFVPSLWALVLTPAATGVIAAALLVRSLRLALGHGATLDRVRLGTLFAASGYMLITIAAMPAAFLFVRADFGNRLDWGAVGHWQSVARLSDAYMQIFGLLLGNALFPRLTRAETSGARHAIAVKMGGILLALFAAGAALLLLIAPAVLRLAYSDAFVAAADQIPTQILGDLFKLLGAILMYALMAEGRLWAQPVAEVLQALLFACVYMSAVTILHRHAPVVAHLVACASVSAILLAGTLMKRTER